MRTSHYTALLLGLCFLGCDSGVGTPTDPLTEVAASPPAKEMLLEVAKSGALGSGAMAIRESLEALKATDSAKAETLLGDLDKLEGLSSPEQIKSLAKQMADKL